MESQAALSKCLVVGWTKRSLDITSFDEDVRRKLLWDDCAGLNAGTDKTSKNPKIQALIDEIINDGSMKTIQLHQRRYHR